MDGFEAIFDGKAGDEPQVEQPVETPAPPPVEAPKPEPEAPPAAAPEPDAPAEPVRDEHGRYAPVAALKEERAKRQELERRIAAMEANGQRAEAYDPDPYDDPEGFKARIAEQQSQMLLQTRFEMSEAMARDKHGDDTVAAAMEWALAKAQSNPGFQQEYLTAKNPIDWAVRQQKRDGLLSEVGDDPDAYVRRRAAELGLIAAPDTGAGVVSVPGQQLAPKPPAPPRSLASMPGTGGSVRDVPVGPTAGLEDIFKR